MADVLRAFCAPHDLAFTAPSPGVARARALLQWRLEVSFLTPHDQAVEASRLAGMALKELTAEKRVLFDFIRDRGSVVLTASGEPKMRT